MIRITKYGLENQITCSAEYIFTLQIENARFLYTFLSDLFERCNGNEGDLHILKGDKNLNFEKNVELITDLISFELNNKKFANLLIKQFASFLKQGENIETIGNLEAITNGLLEKFMMYSTLDLEYNTNLDETILSKSFGLKLKDENKTLLEKLVNYINFAIKLKNIELVVLLFIKEFLTEGEIKYLHKHCEYLNLPLLFIEGNKRDILLEKEKKLIIDKDLCEIVVNIAKL